MKPIDDPNDQSFVEPGLTHLSGSEPPLGVAAACRPNDALVKAITRAAEEHYQQQNPAAALQVMRLLDGLAAYTPETLQTVGNLSFLLGEHEPAGAAYRRALALKPDNVSLLVSLALVDFHLHNHPDSNGFLSRALALEPENLDALKTLADWNLGQQRYQEAALTYGKLIAQDSTRVEICLCLAKCFFETGDKTTAESTLEYVLQLEPNNQLARENLAALRGQGRQSSEAAPASTPASELPPIAAEYLTRADAAYTRGDLPGASELLSQVLAHAPRFVPARLCLGNLQFQLEQYSAALESYSIAQSLEPETVDLLVRLAVTALRCQEIPRFEQALGRALELDATHFGALRLLADVNFQNQHFAEAAQRYRQILQQGTQDTEVLMALGRCEFEMGNLEAARQAFQQASERSPSLEQARENLSVVNEKIALPAVKQSCDSAQLNWGEVSTKLANLKMAAARG